MIETQNISVRLGEHAAISDASISIAGGELVGFIGPNGAGKTSLLRSMLRLAPIESGKVMLGGKDITQDAAHTHARTIAYLPQGQNVTWPLTARRLVALGRLPHLNTWSEMTDTDNGIVDEALSEADALSLQHRPVTELSGGERARVLLARALAVRAPVLLVDEPTASLDPYHQLTTMSALKRARDAGTAVGVVLHDLSLASRYCDRLYLLSEGRIASSGSPDAVLDEEILAQVYRVRIARDTDGHVRLLDRLSEKE